MAKRKASGAQPARSKKAASRSESARGSKTSSGRRRKKGTGQVSAALTEPSTSVELLAKWAVDRLNGNPTETKAFRKLAAVSGGFQASLDYAVRNYGASDLTDDERTFCEGWLYLARVDHHHSDPNKLDKNLVKAAKKHLDNGNPFGMMTG